MIDDDFEAVFRRMMEQFREAFGNLPEGSFTIRSWDGSIVDRPLEPTIEQRSDEPQVEKIDLGDSVLFVIQGHFGSDFEPEVKVIGEELIVRVGLDTPDIHLHPRFNVDRERSTVSYRNGVIEITVVKSENPEANEGLLRIE